MRTCSIRPSTRPSAALIFAAMCCMFLFGSAGLLANSTGQTGHTLVGGTGCGNCHGTTKSDNTTLTLTSETGTFTVAPGSKTKFTLQVAHSTHVRAGCNIAVKSTETGNTDIGSLSVVSGSGLKLVGKEMTHSAKKVISGGTVDFEFEWTAPTAPGDYYIRAISNAVNNNGSSDAGDDWNWLTPVKVTVEAQPSITLTKPTGGVFCPGDQLTIEWESTVIDNVKIDLSSNGGGAYTQVITNSTPASSGSFIWNIPAGQSPGNQYRIRVASAADAAVKDEMSNNFSIAGPPSITMEPVSLERCEGGTATFEVQVDGAGATFQWRKNGTPISGAENIMLTLNGVRPDDAGTYDVVVTGACGQEVTSQGATLSVDKKPSIVTPPQAANVCEGEQIMLEVVADGADLTFAWEKDGQPIPGAVGPMLQIASAGLGDAGMYSVIVSGICSPSVASNPVQVNVGLDPAIVSHSESQAICEGANVVLQVETAGDFNYRWTKDGNQIPGADQPQLAINNASAANAGTYVATVSGPCGADAVSAPIVITITDAPMITNQSGGGQIDEGGSLTLSVTATGADLMYRWRRDGQEIVDAVQNSYTISEATLADAGAYTCVVINDCGQAVSNVMDVSVSPLAEGPAIRTSVTTLEFEGVLTGMDRTESFVISNIGDDVLEITGITSNAAEFTVADSKTLPFTIAPGSEETISIRYAPTSAGEHSGRISFDNNAVNPGAGVALNGEGLAAVASVGNIDFGSTDIAGGPAERMFDIQAGSNGATISAVEFEGVAQGVFALVQFLPVNIDADGSMSLTLQFDPMEAGAYSATMLLTVDGQVSPIEVTLNGEGQVTSSVRYDDKLAQSVTVMPNPMPGGHGVFDIALDGRVELRIVDLQGNTVRRQQVVAPLRWEWDGRDSNGLPVAAGHYRLLIDSGMEFATLPLIVR